MAGIPALLEASGANAQSGTTTTPAAPAAVTPPPVGTLASLVYTGVPNMGDSLVRPLGISAFDGNVYISNTLDNRISLLAGGNTTTVAGSLEGFGENGDGGLATAATLRQPAGTAEDAAGNIYIADTEDQVVRKINIHTGVITRIAGTGQAGGSHGIGLGALATRTQLDEPQGVAVNAQGDVFIADTQNNRVDEVFPNGLIKAFAGRGSAGYSGDHGLAVFAQLNNPTGVAVDAVGNVYIADSSNSAIRRVDARTGIITTVAGNAAADNAAGGLGGYSGDGGPATSAQLDEPQGVALDGAGDLFIADSFNAAIREVTPDGNIFTVVNQAGTGGTIPAQGGETAGPATSSKLNDPSAVAVDSSTNTLYIADTGNNKAAAVTGLAQPGHAAGPGSPAAGH